jgi:hypothetical protein
MPVASAACRGSRRGLYIRGHRDLPPPLIILGMHRSGTSILSQMLRTCGVFIGRELDGHFESPYFRRCNNEILSRAGSSWTDPWTYLERRAEPEFHRGCREWVEEYLKNSFGTRFLGLRHRTALLGGGAWDWGWKDPRTCLTMPVWNEIYPEAKLLHITRHPLDVAISLQRREEERRKAGKRPQPQNADLEQCLRLWESYVAETLRLRDRGARYHELRYEELMRNPRVGLEGVARFCGLDVATAGLNAAAALADGGRTRRFDDEHYEPWRAKAAGLPSAVELGYD